MVLCTVSELIIHRTMTVINKGPMHCQWTNHTHVLCLFTKDRDKLREEMGLMKEAFQLSKSRFESLEGDYKSQKNETERLREVSVHMIYWERLSTVKSKMTVAVNHVIPSELTALCMPLCPDSTVLLVFAWCIWGEGNHWHAKLFAGEPEFEQAGAWDGGSDDGTTPVSYTHLTLPTMAVV